MHEPATWSFIYYQFPRVFNIFSLARRVGAPQKQKSASTPSLHVSPSYIDPAFVQSVTFSGCLFHKSRAGIWPSQIIRQSRNCRSSLLLHRFAIKCLFIRTLSLSLFAANLLCLRIVHVLAALNWFSTVGRRSLPSGYPRTLCCISPKTWCSSEHVGQNLHYGTWGPWVRSTPLPVSIWISLAPACGRVSPQYVAHWRSQAGSGTSLAKFLVYSRKQTPAEAYLT